MKTNFSSRPIFHQNRERIIAHFMICYTALLIFRLLQKKISDEKFRLSPENIVETLQNMQVANLNDFCYMATYSGSKALTALNTIYPLSLLDRKFYLPNLKVEKYILKRSCLSNADFIEIQGIAGGDLGIPSAVVKLS